MFAEFVEVQPRSCLGPRTFYPAIDEKQPDGTVVRMVRVGDRCSTLLEAQAEARALTPTFPGVYVVESRRHD